MKVLQIGEIDAYFRSLHVCCEGCRSIFCMDESDKLQLEDYKISPEDENTNRFYEVFPNEFEDYLKICRRKSACYSKFVLPTYYPTKTEEIEEDISYLDFGEWIRYVCPSEKIIITKNKYVCPVCGKVNYREIKQVPYLIGLIDNKISNFKKFPKDRKISIGTMFSKIYSDTKAHTHLHICYNGENNELPPRIIKKFKERKFAKRIYTNNESVLINDLLAIE